VLAVTTAVGAPWGPPGPCLPPVSRSQGLGGLAPIPRWVARTCAVSRRRRDAPETGRDGRERRQALAAAAGACPFTDESGKHRSVGVRYRADTKLRRALTDFADDSRHANPWAVDLYRRARARGIRHPQAVRVLARAWTGVIWRCWQDAVPYAPACHGALRDRFKMRLARLLRGSGHRVEALVGDRRARA
jgi:hypothetical protein